MSEQTNNNIPRDTVGVSLSKIASSMYKMQLGVNSIRDEVRNLVDAQNAINNRTMEDEKNVLSNN